MNIKTRDSRDLKMRFILVAIISFFWGLFLLVGCGEKTKSSESSGLSLSATGENSGDLTPPQGPPRDMSGASEPVIDFDVQLGRGTKGGQNSQSGQGGQSSQGGQSGQDGQGGQGGQGGQSGQDPQNTANLAQLNVQNKKLRIFLPYKTLLLPKLGIFKQSLKVKLHFDEASINKKIAKKPPMPLI